MFLQSRRFIYTFNNAYSYSDFLSDGKNRYVSNYIGDGCDNRYNYSSKDLDNEVLINITKFNIQAELLRKLENNFTSTPDKLKHIEQYDKIFKDSSIASNLNEGDLYKDWTIDFDLEKK